MSNERSYKVVSISNRKVLVHRLVAAAFHGPAPENFVVHHKDHDKINNCPTNLEYVSRSDNTKYAYLFGRCSKFMLNPLQRKKVVEMYQTGKYLTRDLARTFNVKKAAILRVLRKAQVPIHRHKKVPPALLRKIRDEYVPLQVTCAHLAKKYGLSEEFVRLSVRGFKPFPPKVKGQEELLTKLYMAGKSYVEIGKALGCGIGGIRNGVRMLNLPYRYGNGGMGRIGNGFRIRTPNHPVEGQQG